jgi:hypothetical protein
MTTLSVRVTLSRDPQDELQMQHERVSLQDICEAFHQAELDEAEKLHVISLEEAA